MGSTLGSPSPPPPSIVILRLPAGDRNGVLQKMSKIPNWCQILSSVLGEGAKGRWTCKDEHATC